MIALNFEGRLSFAFIVHACRSYRIQHHLVPS